VVTVSVLILLGWELNILESVVITLAIGLSVDFTLHYGIMYKLSGETDRDKAVTFSIATMASPVSLEHKQKQIIFFTAFPGEHGGPDHPERRSLPPPHKVPEPAFIPSQDQRKTACGHKEMVYAATS